MPVTKLSSHLNRFLPLAALTLLCAAVPSFAADAPAWVNISNAVAEKAGSVKEKGVTGVAIDPATGDVYVGYGHAGIVLCETNAWGRVKSIVV